MNKIKCAVLGTILLACSLSACTEESDNETDKPALFNEIDIIYTDLKNNTSCNKVSTYLKEFEPSALKLYCGEYNESLKTAAGNDVNKLIKNFDNSGYYLAMFLLLDKTNEKVAKCTSDSTTNEKAYEEWTNFFKNNDCGDIIKTATTVAKKYN